MGRRASWLGLLACAPLLLLLGARAADPPAYGATGPYPVGDLVGQWQDTKRDRAVPYRIYYPQGDGPWPVVIFSHGLGGTRDTYAFQGKHWASQGIVAVHLQHLGSDDSVWRGRRPGEIRQAMDRALLDVRNAINRPLDVKFAVDQLAAMNTAEGPLRGKLDLTKLGMAGHSFGAWTTQAIIGARNYRLRVDPGFHDPRFKAAVIESPNNPASIADADKAYGAITVPALHLTGTLDESPVGKDPTHPADRRIPFDHITKADQYLVIFQDADHMVFSGRSVVGHDPERDARIHTWIQAATTAFWKAYLLDDAQAKAWLADGGFKAALDGGGTFEVKPAKSNQLAPTVREGVP